MEAILVTKPSSMGGDGLRARLVSVALEILEREGIEALTLRAVARGAGVSHGAPARHFDNLDDLKAEVAAVGYRIVSEAVSGAMAQVRDTDDPKAPLIATARAYVHCALEHPGLFSLIIRTSTLRHNNEALRRESRAATEGFNRFVKHAQAKGWKPHMEAKLLAASLWAAVYGLANLWMHGAYQQANPDATLDEAIEGVLELG